MNGTYPAAPRVVILTGPCQSGKSTLLFALLYLLRLERLTVAGAIAEGLWSKGMRSGFNLVDLTDGTFTPLCRRGSDGGPTHGTPYSFFENGIAAGKRALSIERCAGADVIIVDEIGHLEVRGEGWAPCLSPLLELRKPTHIWVVRSSCIEEVRRRWGIVAAETLHVEGADALCRIKDACLRNAGRGWAP